LGGGRGLRRDKRAPRARKGYIAFADLKVLFQLYIFALVFSCCPGANDF